MDNIDWQHLLFAFDGRINRGKFWLSLVAIWVIGIVVGGVFGYIVYLISPTLAYLFWFVMYIAMIWIGLAVSIKRWHDRDKSGWWVLIGLVPLIGALWALIETGFLEGTSGDNEYGPDPLAT
jgi:uncharacterized membrane protein YhaH (DUF805 family)